MTIADDEYAEVNLQVGSVARWSPYEGLTDEEADELQAELERRERRRVPLGFRACHEAGAGGWPVVPRFDVLAPSGARRSASGAGGQRSDADHA